MKPIKQIRIVLVLFYTVIFSGCDDSSKPVFNEVIQLGSKREIFVDNYLIDKISGAELVMHTPVDEGPVMYFNKEWEGESCAYVTIIEVDGLYRAYYRGKHKTADNKYIQTTCYAESRDGINWDKPSLGLFEAGGSKENNIILDTEPETHNFSPFIDLNPNVVPDQKYKALGGDSKTGLIPYSSPDGIHWKKMRETGVITKGAFDSQNVSFWSVNEGLYVCYFRIFTAKKIRSVSRTTSKDFINWTEPVEMTYGGTTPEQLYTQQTSPYFRAPHIYLAIGARFMPSRQVLSEEQLINLGVDASQYKGLSEAFFMSTRGGNVYDRTFMEAFIRPGLGFNNWSARSNYPALNVVQTGPEEMSVYLTQDYTQPTAHLHRYSLRLDGFTSISAKYSGGEVLTKPVIFTGKELEVNYSTSAAGEIRIEIKDENGKLIPGFTMDDSKILIGNEISGIASWTGNGNLADLASRPVRLRIYLKDADLYSIRFK